MNILNVKSLIDHRHTKNRQMILMNLLNVTNLIDHRLTQNRLK